MPGAQKKGLITQAQTEGGNPIQSGLTNEQPVKDIAAKGQKRKQAAGQH